MTATIKRPVWYIWIFGKGAAMCRFADDSFSVDKDGFAHCEYPVLVTEQVIPNKEGGPPQIAFQAQPLSVMVDTANVKLLLAGYTKCGNDTLIGLWEKVSNDLRSTHSSLVPATQLPNLKPVG